MLKIKALESSFNSFFFFYFVCIPSATPTDFASKIHLESADFSPFATCSKPSSAPLCTITIASLLVGLSRMLISFSLFSTQEPKCSFLKHRSDLVTPLHMILHGFPISEYKLKSLERLPTPCMNRFSHFLISSPNILSLYSTFPGFLAGPNPATHAPTQGLCTPYPSYWNSLPPVIYSLHLICPNLCSNITTSRDLM